MVVWHLSSEQIKNRWGKMWNPIDLRGIISETQRTNACWILAPALTSFPQALPKMCFVLVKSSSALVPWAPLISCPSCTAAPLPASTTSGLTWAVPGTHLGFPRSNGTVREKGCTLPCTCGPKAQRPRSLSFVHAACCQQPACSSISWLVYCPSLKKIRSQTPQNTSLLQCCP